MLERWRSPRYNLGYRKSVRPRPAHMLESSAAHAGPRVGRCRPAIESPTTQDIDRIHECCVWTEVLEHVSVAPRDLDRVQRAVPAPHDPLHGRGPIAPLPAVP